jgi:fibronectin-binding autotransporter adhesin
VGGGLLTLNGESLTNVSGNNTYSGPVTAAASSRIFVTSGTLTLSNTITASSNPITFSGNGVTLITGNLGAGLTSLDINAKASDVPTVIVAGSNPDFTGTVEVQVGSLQLGNGGTTGSLPTDKAITIGGASPNARFIVKQSDLVTQGTDFFSGPLSGQGGFMQAGSGTTVLNSANDYLGTTNVDVGKLIINGNQAGATGAVTVASGATLGGSGTIGGAASVFGTLAPTSDFTQLRINGTTTLNSGSIYEWDLNTENNTRGAGYDALNTVALAGTGAIFKVVLSGTQDFSDTFWNGPQIWADIFKTADGGANLNNWASVFGGGFEFSYNGKTLVPTSEGSFSLNGNSLEWSPVPETSNAVVGLLLAGGLWMRRRSL